MEGVLSFKIGQYKDLNLQKATINISEEEIESSLIRFIDPYLKIIPKDDGIAIGDYIQISYEMKDETENLIPHGKVDNYNTRIGYGYLLEDFEKQLIGMRKGDMARFNMTLPKDYKLEKYQSKKVSVHISVLEVNHKEVVEITDDFIGGLGLGNLKTLDAVKTHIRNKIYTTKVQETSQSIINELIAKILDDCLIEYDEDIVNYYAYNAYDQYTKAISQNPNRVSLNSDNDDALKELKISEYKEEIRTTLLELALFNTLIERENIDLNENEKENAIKSYCLRTESPRESVNVKDIEKAILYKKVIEILIRENMVK